MRMTETSSYINATLKLWEDRKRKSQEITVDMRKMYQ
jgi:hypothetical protein